MSASGGGPTQFARDHPTVVGASLLLTYSGLKLAAIASGDVAVLLTLAQTVGTGSVLLASVAQLFALVAFPLLVFFFAAAAVHRLARAVTVPAGVAVLFFSLAAAPWWLLVIAMVSSALYAWTADAPVGSWRKRLDEIMSGRTPRSTGLALAASGFVLMACVLPIAPGEILTLRDGSRLVGETYGARDGFTAVLLADGDIRMVPLEQIVARRVCRRVGDANWDSFLSRLVSRRPPCAQVANERDGGDASASDDSSAESRE